MVNPFKQDIDLITYRLSRLQTYLLKVFVAGAAAGAQRWRLWEVDKKGDETNNQDPDVSARHAQASLGLGLALNQSLPRP
ncbi:hypothetical protein [Pseudomonas sp. B392_1p]|jgi:hypothetical protein|uniref:hypothetical protein n=1 Tax=Pseudomonas sp. B392_1p TaxID=3457507 RepID=UPI003FD0B665